MIKNYSWLFIGVVILAFYQFSCSDPIVDLEIEREKIRQDSLIQGNIDNEIIEQYILDNNLSDLTMDITKYSISKYNTRLIVVKDGDGVNFPEVNNIISVGYTGKFVDNEIFDTSIKSLALSLDSTAWVKKGVNVAEYMSENTVDLESTLIAFSAREDALELPYFNSNGLYQPITFNYTPDGVYIPATRFVQGFYTGLKTLVPKLSLGGKGLVIMPSAVAYGASSSASIIPPNTVIVFELDLTQIRR